MSDMFDNMVKFPVDIDFKILYRTDIRKDVVIKYIKYIHRSWRSITSTVVQPEFIKINYSNYGVLTGGINGITVLNIDQSVNDCLLGYDTASVITPSGNVHKIFQYEPSLHTIYNLASGISVHNDRSCVFGGTRYKINCEHPINKMPEALLSYLHERQAIYEGTINNWLYDLLNILPEKAFNDEKEIKRIVACIRNKPLITVEEGINTLCKILFERSDSFHPRIICELFNAKLSSVEQKYTLYSIEKNIKLTCPHEYETWLLKHRVKKSILAQRLKYKAGSFVKLSELNAIYNLTAEQFCLIDRRFKIVNYKICKSCNQKHKKGCCERYSRTNRTTAVFIENAKLV